MKGGWTIRPLGELCQFHRGLTYAKQDEADNSNNIVLRATNIDLESNNLNLAELKYINNRVVVPESKKVKKDSLIICTASGSKSHLGKIAYIDRDYPYAFGGFMGMITPNPELLPRYLFYSLISEEYKDFIAALADGANINNLKFDQLSLFPVPYPPLAEQTRIVGILDKAFEAIATARTNAERTRNKSHGLYESYLESIFSACGSGWRTSRLSDLCEIKHGFAFKGNFFTDRGDYVVLTPGNFFESGGYRDRGDKQKYYKGEIPAGYILKQGDLLVAMTEQAAGLLGSPILVPESNRFLHNQRLGLVLKKPGLPWTNEFFFHVFNRPDLRKEIHFTASGVKVRHTSPSKIGDITVKYPPSETEQLTIANRLNKLVEKSGQLVDLYKHKCVELDALKYSILSHAFDGQL